MSFLPPDILPGEPYLLGMVTSAGPTQPFFAPASGGGGGGGGGPNLVCSTLTTNSGDGTWGGVPDINPQSQQFGIGSSTITQMNNWGDLAGDVAYTIGATTTAQVDFTFFISTVNSVVPPISEEGTFLQIYSDANPATGGILSMGAQPDGTGYVAVTSQGTPTVSTLFLVANQVKIFPEGDLVVSSINGQAPGGGASLFTSSFSLACPGQASTLVMEVPAGQYAYMGEALFTGAKAFLSGRLSALYNVTATQWSANFMADDKGTNDPADSQPSIEMTINYGRNPLSTIELLVANNNTAGSGDCTWVGVVGKLY